MLCAGNHSEFCGGPNRLNVYNFTGTGLGTGGNTGTTAVGVFPVLSGLPTGWAYNACWVYVFVFVFSCFDFLMDMDFMCCLSVTTLMGGSSPSSCLEARPPTLSSLVSLDALLITLRLLVPSSPVSRKESPVESNKS